MLICLLGTVSAATVVKETFRKTYHIDARNYEYTSCNEDANWESGECSFIYACGIVVPKGATEISQAVTQPFCEDITDSKQGSIEIVFTPPRGNQYAVVTFLAEVKHVYDHDTYQWNEEDPILPLDYRSAEEAISLCKNGEMLSDGLCFPAQAVCLDSYKTNLCDNPYPLFTLDYGYGFDLDNQAHYCADRDEDLICDKTTSYLCSDSNNNGVCDEDDISIQNSSCVDSNQNFVCDTVEASGVFCTSTYDPVHVGSGESCVTYPNSCFAEGLGKSIWNSGTCEPVYGNFCYSNSDCTSPCDGVSGICKNPDNLGNRCFYTGECNPRKIQCSVDTDCPGTPCAGVTFQCSDSNTCVSAGKCISKPVSNPAWWEKIWQLLVRWISGQ